jgi:predicted transcriptional regulator
MPVISLKVSPADARRIRALARARKKTVSAYLREQALPAPPSAERRVSLKKHRASGLSYDAAPGPPVTDEEIQAALVDFP